MFSIEEAKYAHPCATHHIPAGVRHEWGAETIARELDADATAVNRARVGKLKNALTGLYQRIVSNALKSAPAQPAGPDAALRIGD